ncbi:MAG: GTP 3',8-cyclase MoaA [Clostridia bacterium]|nr:GTP 3',8-cyclase MoaA [Clostridia bacterium]
MVNKIKDRYDRVILSLRISITNRCNVNCIYCHHDGMLDTRSEMTPDEIFHICKLAKKIGVEKIRLSGGEPLVRKDLVEIVKKVSTLDFKDISITTNGIFLKDIAQELYDAGLNRLNVSLDTLDDETYQNITGKSYLDEVKAGLIKSVEVGLSPVKINMVVMKDINHHEIKEMFEFSKENNLVLQLIEIIESESCDDNDFNSKYHYELDEFEKHLAEIADDVRVRKNMQDRKKYYIDGGEIEIVHPVENSNFCKNCTRLRITPEGKIKPCLLRNDNLVDLVKYMREGYSEEDLLKIFVEGINNREPFYTEE